MNDDMLELLPLDEQVVHWIDGLAEGLGGHALAAGRLMERHRRYYGARVPGFMELPGDTAWWGECPCCDGLLAIDGLTGWWICAGCMRRGEVFTMEYLLHGCNEPQRWALCQRTAETLMAGAATAEREVA